MRKNIITLLFLIFLNPYLFSLGSSNKKALNEIKKVIITDKTIRVFSILPYDNNTKNDYYSYIGKSIQKFLYNQLLILQKIQITTNDIYIPEKYKTNNKIIFDYGTNFTRNPVFIEPENVNKIYYKIISPENKKLVAQKLNSDYLIYGEYKFFNPKNETFIVKTYIYNYAQDKIYSLKEFVISKDKIETDVEQITDEILKFFNKIGYGTLKIVTNFTNFVIFIDNKFFENKLIFDNLLSGNYLIKMKLQNDITLTQRIEIKKDLTNIVYFTNLEFSSNNSFLNINSEPTNAEVYLDIKYAGNTPLILSNVPLKKYRLKLEKKGFQSVVTQIYLTEKTNNLFFKLKELKLYNQIKKYRIIQYTSLGIGCLSIISAYYFYAKGDIYYDKYVVTRNEKYWNNYVYNTVTAYSLAGIGLTSLTISLIYYIKIINLSEIEVSIIKNDKNYLSLNFYKRF